VSCCVVLYAPSSVGPVVLVVVVVAVVIVVVVVVVAASRGPDANTGGVCVAEADRCWFRLRSRSVRGASGGGGGGAARC